MLEPIPQSEAKAQQLIQAARRNSYDPHTDVDWSLPVDDQALYVPPKWHPLYGTSLWEAMSDTERRVYSRHEAAAWSAVACGFENIFLRIAANWLAGADPTLPSFHWMLTANADECRHSIMFADFIRRADCHYVFTGLLEVEEDLTTTKGEFLAFLFVLLAEEVYDAMNRDVAADETLDPVFRQICKIHTLEEGRHVSFAKTFIAEIWPTLSEEDQAKVKKATPVLIRWFLDQVINPDVYEVLGLDGGFEAAKNNPVFAATMTGSLNRIQGFLAGMGFHEGATVRAAWERNRLPIPA